MSLAGRINDAAAAALSLARSGRLGGVALRGGRSLAGEPAYEIGGAVTDAGQLALQRIAFHPPCRSRLNGPGDSTELLRKREEPLLERAGRVSGGGG